MSWMGYLRIEIASDLGLTEEGQAVYLEIEQGLIEEVIGYYGDLETLTFPFSGQVWQTWQISAQMNKLKEEDYLPLLLKLSSRHPEMEFLIKYHTEGGYEQEYCIRNGKKVVGEISESE